MDIERRIPGDRRKQDIGPPSGLADRRRQAERRLPAAEETELSADEFARYFGAIAGMADAAASAATPRERSEHPPPEDPLPAPELGAIRNRAMMRPWSAAVLA